MRARANDWPFLPEVRLFHDRAKCRKFVRERLGIDPEFLGTGAQTWYGNDTAVVLMEFSGNADTELALLVHEAVHVVTMHFEQGIGEEPRYDEFLAYGVQAVSRALFETHGKWKRKV